MNARIICSRKSICTSAYQIDAMPQFIHQEWSRMFLFGVVVVMGTGFNVIYLRIQAHVNIMYV